MTWSPPTTPGDSYSYDDLGKILSKSDYADTYNYDPRPGEPKMPHAVRKVSLAGADKASFLYDANGNLISGDGRTITFDDFDRPVKVAMGSVTTIFRYAPDGSRYLQQTTTASGSIKTVYYMGKYYERVDWSDGKQTEEHTYIGPSIAVYQSGSKHDVRYMHLDRLGSVEAVTSSTGTEMPYDGHSFDAFGKPRARDWQAQDKLHPTGDYTATTEHGFTGHEHLDDTYLIHMNGRVYDYRLGRFLSVDPIISGSSSQALNPYSYVGNNPLSGTDPSGYDVVPAAGGPYGSLGGGECKFQTCGGTTPGGEAIKLTDTSNGAKSTGAVGGVNAPNSSSAASDTGSATQVAQSGNNGQASNVLSDYWSRAKAIGAATSDWLSTAPGNLKDYLSEHKSELQADAMVLLLDGLITPMQAQELRAEAGQLETVIEGELVAAERAIAGESTAEVARLPDPNDVPESRPVVDPAATRSDLPRNAHLAGENHPITGVPFDKTGHPDFKAAGVVKAEVQITQTGTRPGDFRAANKAAGFGSTPEGYTWHHHQDGTTMQLVPRDIHQATGHTGGFTPF
jgi:RHS repeat-associated protein